MMSQGFSKYQKFIWIVLGWLCKIVEEGIDFFIYRKQSYLGNNDFLMVKRFYNLFYDLVVLGNFNELDVFCLQKINNIFSVNLIQ